jgi:DMSO/TMAO reductase YedYZ molybdopterin-dependent catalytic subunit
VPRAFERVRKLFSDLGILPQARYLIYFSMDPDWWESIDMVDAQHPQTLLTWAMNDGDLPVPFGGPLLCGCLANLVTRASNLSRG